MSFLRALSVAMCSMPLFATATAVAADSATTTVVEDAYFGDVLFHFYQEDYFPAIVRLLAAQERQRLPHHDAEAELLLGGLFLSYGHHQRAAAIFEQLLDNSSDQALRDRTWFFLARVWHQRGYFEEARRALSNVKGDLPGSMPAEGRLRLAQILIDHGDFDGAIDLLDRFRDNTEWSSYARFNLGVALVRNGDTAAAASILDNLGLIDSDNEEIAALRDKANLALGYAYLQQGDALKAKVPLQRVRLNGPFSNKALLGVGWADADRNNFEGALVPWTELRGRNLLDPAVQEAFLAVPYAMAQADANNLAAEHYLAAIAAFKQESGRIDQTIAALQSGELLASLATDNARSSTGWHWQLDSLPDADGSRYLYLLLASHEFQEGLKNYRDLDYLARNLERWNENLDVFRNMLDTRRQAFSERLPQVQRNLTRAGLGNLVKRKLAFDQRLDTVERDRNLLAMATENESLLWGDIVRLEASGALQAGTSEAADLRQKVRLLKGVIQWQLDKEFKERVWRVRRNVRLSGEALVEAERTQRSVNAAVSNEPKTFREFDDRIQVLEPRISVLRARVDAVLNRQRAFLQAIAVGEMRAQQDRLRSYAVQARFALAAIYDRSATTASAQ